MENDKIQRLKLNCPYLTNLDLSYQNLDISKVKILSHFLKKNTYLTSLNLEGNDIDNEGSTILCNMLHTNSTLTELNLVNTKIKDTGARALGKIVNKRNPPIHISLFKHFVISGCYKETMYHIIKI